MCPRSKKFMRIIYLTENVEKTSNITRHLVCLASQIVVVSVIQFNVTQFGHFAWRSIVSLLLSERFTMFGGQQ